MKESIITATMIVCGLVLTIIVGVGKFAVDKTAPVISLEGKNTLTYTNGDSYETLLEGVMASDEVSGDVTDSVRVSDFYVVSENKAIVVYVAKDEANNIGKLKREVHYQERSEIPEVTEEVANPEQAVEQQEEVVEAQPILMMIQNEATLKVGESFNLLRYIEGAVDVDGSSLNQYIHAEGTYDMSQPGVYSIRLYATSPAGKTSNIETFTLTVTP